MTPPPDTHPDSPENHRSGAVSIHPPVDLLARRPGLAGVGIGTQLAEAVTG